MNLTFDEAKRLGLSHLWPGKPTPPDYAGRPRGGQDGMNKLEASFWARLCEARDRHTFQLIWREPFRLHLAGNKTTYKPDFMTFSSLHQLTCWETKGFMRDDAACKLKLAASLFPCFAWVLVQRDRGAWRCTDVTPRGFARESYVPEWLAT